MRQALSRASRAAPRPPSPAGRCTTRISLWATALQAAAVSATAPSLRERSRDQAADLSQRDQQLLGNAVPSAELLDVLVADPHRSAVINPHQRAQWQVERGQGRG